MFIADDTPARDGKQLEWKPAGIWYLAGSNTCVYSNPKEELGATQHIVQTSNRRFRDDEFLVPRDLTAGRSAIRLRIKFTPVKTPLFPGRPLPDLAWSEIHYTAYCFVLPRDPENQSAKLSNPIERSLLFAPAKFPEGNWRPAGLEFEDARFASADGTHLHGWFVPHDSPRAVILFAHGNGGNITHRAEMLRALHDRMHVAVMIFDYRGYGRSEGSPDEAGILADARAARTWLAKRRKSRRAKSSYSANPSAAPSPSIWPSTAREGWRSTARSTHCRTWRPGMFLGCRSGPSCRRGSTQPPRSASITGRCWNSTAIGIKPFRFNSAGACSTPRMSRSNSSSCRALTTTTAGQPAFFRALDRFIGELK